MSTLKLLPRWYRFVGIALIVPAVLIFCYDPEVSFGDVTIFGEPSGPLVFSVPSFFGINEVIDGEEVGFSFVRMINNNMANEILLTMMLLGTYFVAFSKIKDEDEFSNQLRLESMVKAILYNSVLLLILNFMIYDGLFLYVMISQLFSYLLIFSVIFALKIRNQRKVLGNEE